jgi:hypothetical protein
MHGYPPSLRATRLGEVRRDPADEPGYTGVVIEPRPGESSPPGPHSSSSRPRLAVVRASERVGAAGLAPAKPERGRGWKPFPGFHFNRLSDARLTLLVALALFVLAAWPLLLVDLPPLQDLPNHVASAHIIAHPDLYPEYVFNGFFKSNSLLIFWLYLMGSHGLYGAARGFTAVVLAGNALALPLFVLHFAGRRALPVAALFLWPLVHGFFVSMGMLNFALAFPLSLILLTVIDGQRERPTLARGFGIAAIACVLAYAHPFPLIVVAGLVVLDAATRATWRTRVTSGIVLLLPLAPAGLLCAAAAQQHLVKAERASALVTTAFSYLKPWEILEHFWLDASGALTWRGSMTIVPAILLPYFAWRARRAERPVRPFFSTGAVATLAAAYLALPLMLSNWWYLNCRLVPFLWAGLALRLPSTLPRPVAVALAACALAFSTVMGIDYARLDRDRAEFTAGMDAVPARATLLPLLFKHGKTGDFTTSLAHAWGYYTVAKDASAPLAFAVERSYPISYRDLPPRALIPPALDRFAELHGTPAQECEILGKLPGDPACTVAWRKLWADFWRQAEPRFSHVLTWGIPAEARPMLPKRYHRVFAAGELEIYVRGNPATGSPATAM